MRILWGLIGGIALILAVLGAVLPVMPTVPFLLVAAWAFARSSPALQQRILNNRVYGPQVRAWQEKGAISRLAKLWAVSAMIAGVGMALWLSIPLWLVAIQSCICIALSVFIVTRPEA